MVEVPVGNALLGRVVNALGQPIDGKGPITTDKYRPVERVASGVISRKEWIHHCRPVSKPLIPWCRSEEDSEN